MLPCNCYNRKGSKRGQTPKGQTSIKLETSTITRMAKQHHYDNLSQHFQQYSCHSHETQCLAPEAKHDSRTASQFSTKYHDQQHQWSKQHQLSFVSLSRRTECAKSGHGQRNHGSTIQHVLVPLGPLTLLNQPTRTYACSHACDLIDKHVSGVC